MTEKTAYECPKCGWLGASQGTQCPNCSAGLQKLAQKGLDKLRSECRLLPKMSYARNMTEAQKMERLAQIERLFYELGT